MQTKELSEAIDRAVEVSIKKHVNGKIDSLNSKLDAHIETVEPILQGLEASKTVARATLWISGAIAAVGTAFLVIKQVFLGR